MVNVPGRLEACLWAGAGGWRLGPSERCGSKWAGGVEIGMPETGRPLVCGNRPCGIDLGPASFEDWFGRVFSPQ